MPEGKAAATTIRSDWRLASERAAWTGDDGLRPDGAGAIGSDELGGRSVAGEDLDASGGRAHDGAERRRARAAKAAAGRLLSPGRSGGAGPGRAARLVLRLVMAPRRMAASMK